MHFCWPTRGLKKLNYKLFEGTIIIPYIIEISFTAGKNMQAENSFSALAPKTQKPITVHVTAPKPSKVAAAPVSKTSQKPTNNVGWTEVSDQANITEKKARRKQRKEAEAKKKADEEEIAAAKELADAKRKAGPGWTTLSTVIH